jgi:putative oxidoreductase
MYADHTTLETVAQLLLVVTFLGSALINSTVKFKRHLDHIAEIGLPFPGVSLCFGFVVQYVGSLMLLFDYRADIGAILLIIFTIAATALFHRFWLVEDPLLRHLSQAFCLTNCGVVAGLLLLI